MNENNPISTPETDEDSAGAAMHVLAVRNEKLKSLRQNGIEPYAATQFHTTHHAAAAIAEFDALCPPMAPDADGEAAGDASTVTAQASGQTPAPAQPNGQAANTAQVNSQASDDVPPMLVSLAGRMMSKRVMGKAAFAHLQDASGQIQLYFKRDILGDEPYALFRELDIGDILGVSGRVFRTHKGEVSVEVSTFSLLSKSLYPLPEKFHGLRNADLRYRQRYVDLIVNPDVQKVFRQRSMIMQTIRQTLNAQGFLEVDTPVLHPEATGAAAKPFVTHHHTLDMDMYMRIETELHLKRLIVGGLERVYEIGRIFRNEGMSTKHNPEFTTIELYQAFANYHDMAALAEQLFAAAAMAVHGTTQITYQGQVMDLAPPWRRMTMVEAVQAYTGIDFSTITTAEQAYAAAETIGVGLAAGMTMGQVLYECFDQRVESQLTQPTFIFDYPIEVSPLARRKADQPLFTERFEFFMAGWEGGNAFSELNDPHDQRARFVEQLQKKMAGDGEAHVDEDFIHALEIGLPPTGGMGIGIDRMVMLLTDSASIRDVILFPTMKPLPADQA